MIVFYTTMEGGCFKKAKTDLRITEVARRLDGIHTGTFDRLPIPPSHYHYPRQVNPPRVFIPGIPEGFFAILLPDGSIWDVIVGWDDEYVRSQGRGRYREVQRIIKAREAEE